MKENIMYIELKTGYEDNGPAWIGRVFYSKSGKTIYFNGKAFRSSKGSGIGGNYFDIETNEQYWFSGIKKNQKNRHWAGSGKIMIEEDIIDQYLELIGKDKFEMNNYTKIKPNRPDIINKIYEIENRLL